MKVKRKRYWVVLQRKDKRFAQHWKLSCWNQIDGNGHFVGSLTRDKATRELPPLGHSTRQTYNYKIVRRLNCPPTR